jgi:hypothetical protein
MMPHSHPCSAASGRASCSIPASIRPCVSSSSSFAAHVIRLPRPHAAQVPLWASCSRPHSCREPRLLARASSNGAAATAAANSGSEAAGHAEAATSSTAGISAVDQLQWEAEIEETLKLVRLLPPTGECGKTGGSGVAMDVAPHMCGSDAALQQHSGGASSRQGYRPAHHSVVEAAAATYVPWSILP